MSSWVEATFQQNDRTPEVDLLSSPDESVQGLLHVVLFIPDRLNLSLETDII